MRCESSTPLRASNVDGFTAGIPIADPCLNNGSSELFHIWQRTHRFPFLLDQTTALAFQELWRDCALDQDRNPISKTEERLRTHKDRNRLVRSRMLSRNMSSLEKNGLISNLYFSPG